MAKMKFKPVDSKVNFVEKEQALLEWWYSSGLVEKYLHKNDASKKLFSFLDGPITANNPMGVHHAWGRTFKDLWQRYFNMKGYKQRFQNGFDCQGLWVEVEVEKDLGFKLKKDIEVYGVAGFVNKCKERVLKYSMIQTQQSKRLGYFMDWENSYFTMSDENNYAIWNFLKVCFERGWIYKGHDSVPWCPRCETAISQHEILTEDYKEVSHKAVYFALPIEDTENEFLLVWTTTPWTLPANIAVAIDEKLDYFLVNGKDGNKYWVVKGREGLINEEPIIDRIVKGKELVGLRYKWVFDSLNKVKEVAKNNPGKFHVVVATDSRIMPITTTEGTGLVHTAVSAGAEDFNLGKKLGLPMIPVIADNADYLSDLDWLSGQNAKKHPEIILDFMQSESNDKTPWVFKIENYTHRYPACWRCKTELVWKVADEWYIAMDKQDSTDSKKRTLRQEMVDVTNNIIWLPSFGLERELDWLKNMHDWLISKKNRYWGLALPIYECKKCGNYEVLGSREELKKRAIEGWEKFEGNTPHKPWIDEVRIKCSKCGETVGRIPDVGNPWLDAGIVSFSTMSKEWYPADFITESFPGQFKNWFYSLIAMGTVLSKNPPFKTVLGYGTLVGEDGRPMHKSWGNSIEFNEGADKIGVDVMRWMYVTHQPEDNLLFGYHVADEVRRRFHLILWNVYSFFVTYATVSDWEPKKVENESINILDKWVLARLNQVVSIVTSSLDKYDVYTAATTVESFVSDLSTWYIRRSRDRMDEEFFATCYEVLVTLCKILAPFTPFIAEEMYMNLTGEASVHLSDWPTARKVTPEDEELLNMMVHVRKTVERAHGIRKNLGIKLRQPLAALYLFEDKIDPKMVKQYEQLLREELNVKEVRYENFKKFIDSDKKLESTDTWLGDINDPLKDIPIYLDANLTPELIAEGKARDLVREIQEARKTAGTALDEKIVVQLPDWPKEFEEYIKKETLASRLEKSETLTIVRFDKK